MTAFADSRLDRDEARKPAHPATDSLEPGRLGRFFRLGVWNTLKSHRPTGEQVEGNVVRLHAEASGEETNPFRRASPADGHVPISFFKPHLGTGEAMSIPTGRQLSNDFHSMLDEHRERQRARITGENIEATGIIRTAKVLSAREAVGRYAFETPDIFDASLDLLIDRAYSEVTVDAARRELADEAFNSMCETDR